MESTALSPEIVDRLASDFVDTINSLFGVLPADFHIFYFALALISFVVAIGKMMWMRSISPAAEFFKFYLFLMVLLVVSDNWNTMADTWVGWMSKQAYEAVGFDASYLAPSVVLTQGFRITAKLYESGISFYRIFLGSSDDSIAGIILLIAIAAFLWAVVQMVAVLVMTMVFFKISSLLALCLLPFILLNITRFAAAPGVVRVLQYGVQFWTVSLIIGLAFKFMDGIVFTNRPDANQVLSFAIGVGVLCTLMKHGMHVAREHIAGTPMLSMREGVGTLREATQSLNNTGNRLYNAMKMHSREVGHGGGVGGMTSRAFSAMRNIRIGQSPANSSFPTAQPVQTVASQSQGQSQGTPKWAAAARAKRATTSRGGKTKP